jgi:RNA polymerase sigma factor (sigma-70 family)
MTLVEKDPNQRPDPESLGETVKEAYSRYQAELHKFGQARLRNRQNAGDLVQEVFLQLVRFPPAEALRDAQAYVYRVAWHILNRENRKAAQSPVSYHEPKILSTIADTRSQTSANDTLDAIAFKQQFKRVLQELPPEQQAALILFKRDGLTHKEIARRLGISSNTVKVYISRAVAHFKNADWKQS